MNYLIFLSSVITLIIIEVGEVNAQSKNLNEKGTVYTAPLFLFAFPPPIREVEIADAR